MIRRAVLAALVVIGSVAPASAQGTILIVRHAERADGGAGAKASADPDLALAGHARAKSLAEMLRDTKLTAIYATEFKRTQQTAAPVAQAQGLSVSTIAAGNSAALLEKLRTAAGAILVVGHSDTVPEIMAGLGVAPAITVGDTEFDNLFIVTTGPDLRVIRLRYK